jgi:hypothetical protein
MKRRDLVWLALLIGVAPIAGCQIKEHPWSGEPYQEPTGYRNPPSSIYAPMPSILPSIDGGDIQADQPSEGDDPILKLHSAG